VPSTNPPTRTDGTFARIGDAGTREDVDLVLAAHAAVLPAVEHQAGTIADAVDLIVSVLSRGGRIRYVGAGTSGWLAALDAAEVIVTFGMTDRVDWLVGGGVLLDPVAMTLGDDDVSAPVDGAALDPFGRGDVVIAVSASGRTPYTLAAATRLRDAGAQVVAIVNGEDSPLAALADVEVCVPVRSEPVVGSTRLTAGMAQKVVLNTISTAAFVRFGRVVDGEMVCVLALNDKLRARIVTAISRVTGVDEEAAAAALTTAGAGDVAVVSLLASVSVNVARERLDQTFGSIPAALMADAVDR
jgi:N-acetylmuramic acid 6-phosphate etherase